MTSSSGSPGLRQDALGCLRAGIAAVEPEGLVRGYLEAHPASLPGDRPVRLVAIGKAAPAMVRGAAAALGERLTGGVAVVAPGGDPGPLPAGVTAIAGGHPVPDEGSVAAGSAVLELARGLRANDLLLCLISGGGSALMTLPPESVTLGELRAATDALLRAGATIGELNAVRKHLDRLKGGRLARAAAPARTLALVLSDVVGDPLDVIASGPVSPDPTTFAEAVAAMRRLGVWQAVSPAIRERLEAGLGGEIEESPKPDDPCFARVRVEVVGNNRLAAEAALAEAERRGYLPLLLTTELTGEARDAGRRLAAQALATRREGLAGAATCLLAAGETTVTVVGPGRGGRNQELALGAAFELAGRGGVLLLSAGTDGIDGPTDAAGAIVDGATLERAAALGLDPEAALAGNDAYPFFEALGDLIVTGPTGTNVMDLQVVLVAG